MVFFINSIEMTRIINSEMQKKHSETLPASSGTAVVKFHKLERL